MLCSELICIQADNVTGVFGFSRSQNLRFEVLQQFVQCFQQLMHQWLLQLILDLPFYLGPQQSGSECGSIEFGNTGDNAWSVGDGVTIVESGSNLCSGGCDIDFTIIDVREGMLIAEGYTYAY